MDNREQKMQEALLSYIDDTKKRDLCPVYKNRELMDEILSWLAEPFYGNVDYVAAPESIGFVLGSMLARELGVGFIPIRNASLSYLEDDDKIVASYIDHNNQVKSLHIRVSNFPKGGRILLVDNWIDTAATMQTCLTIIEEGEGVLAGIATLGAAVNDATRGMLESGQIRCIVKKV